MSLKYLKVNSLIDIDINNHFVKGKFPSRVEMMGPQAISVAYPIFKGALIPIRRGEKVQVTFVEKNQAFIFTSHVIGRVDKPIPMLVIEYPSEVNKLQRREYVRLEVSMPLEFRIIESNEDAGGDDIISYPYKGYTINISGGGVLFMTKHEVQMEELLELRMNLPKRENLVLQGKPVRIERRDNRGDRVYNVAVCFTAPKEVDRDAIIAFIFEKQREILKKGLDRG